MRNRKCSESIKARFNIPHKVFQFFREHCTFRPSLRTDFCVKLITTRPKSDSFSTHYITIKKRKNRKSQSSSFSFNFSTKPPRRDSRVSETHDEIRAPYTPLCIYSAKHRNKLQPRGRGERTDRRRRLSIPRRAARERKEFCLSCRAITIWHSRARERESSNFARRGEIYRVSGGGLTPNAERERVREPLANGPTFVAAGVLTRISEMMPFVVLSGFWDSGVRLCRELDLSEDLDEYFGIFEFAWTLYRGYRGIITLHCCTQCEYIISWRYLNFKSKFSSQALCCFFPCIIWGDNKDRNVHSRMLIKSLRLIRTFEITSVI